MCAGVPHFRGFPVDVWALGVTLYIFTFGKLPFEGSNILELNQSVIHNDLTFPRKLADDLKDLLEILLKKDPETRATISDIRKHPWVTRDGKEPLISEEENAKEVYVTEEDEKGAYGVAKVSFDNLAAVALGATKWKRRSTGAIERMEKPLSRDGEILNQGEQDLNSTSESKVIDARRRRITMAEPMIIKADE